VSGWLLGTVFTTAIERVSSIVEATATARLVRTLRSGLVFDSQLLFEYNARDPEQISVRLEIVREEKTTLFEAVFRGSTLVRVSGSGPGVDFDYNTDSLPVDLENIPVGIGDIDLGNLRRIFDALTEENVEWLGHLGELGSEKTGVFSLSLQPNGHAPEPGSSGEVMGASALLYIAPGTLPLPRAIRIFNENGRLIGTYDDFVFDEPDRPYVPKSFRIDSVPSSSHTTVNIESIDWLVE
jgi:hypothetical protein